MTESSHPGVRTDTKTAVSHIPQVSTGELFLGSGSLGRGKKRSKGGGGGEYENVSLSMGFPQ